ncbi:MAG: ChaN family lipoprotein [Hydrogenophaga sp.]|uniref:ChaN family lipoprotein n=1 Tax=Hydrogenophaga sp. TaxID=1904254 RepID=UPI0027520548|nr:ChaN family lipoprotein [Hydrogenophaga sp.]MDP2417068.1 ChaN family lipoprotein [Hydrogenophaga sp.]MDZ4189462.1 ChaN family lipoprotein [Hydrogenophaga sp.]
MNCRSAVTWGRRATQITATAAALCATLAACGSTTPPSQAQAALLVQARQLPASPLVLLGEQHDAPEHQAMQRATVQTLSQRGQLAALVLEMAEQGQQTTGLPRSASETEVRQALKWTDEAHSGWPWVVYGPVVMAAVAAGVPVLGGNLPRTQMRAAMGNTELDQQLPPEALAQQQTHIREGHCGLLPEGQIEPMTRIQIARDRTLAEVAVAALRPGQTVLLVAGNGHVRRDLGVPQHLPAGLPHHVVMVQAGSTQATPSNNPADTVWTTPPGPPTDHCAVLKKQMGR